MMRPWAAAFLLVLLVVPLVLLVVPLVFRVPRGGRAAPDARASLRSVPRLEARLCPPVPPVPSMPVGAGRCVWCPVFWSVVSTLDQAPPPPAGAAEVVLMM